MGWRGQRPVRYEELVPHYAAANAFMQVDFYNYGSDLEICLQLPNPGFDPDRLNFHFSKWAPQPDFFKLKRRILERKIPVLYNAHLIGIQFEGKLIRAVEVANFVGQASEISVDKLILATGGIEACRTLLLAAEKAPGTGNIPSKVARASIHGPSNYRSWIYIGKK